MKTKYWGISDIIKRADEIVTAVARENVPFDPVKYEWRIGAKLAKLLEDENRAYLKCENKRPNKRPIFFGIDVVVDVENKYAFKLYKDVTGV